MEKYVGFEIVAFGKMDDYKAWWKKRDKRLQELGMARLKMYQVKARKNGMVFYEWPEMKPEEGEKWGAQNSTDEVIQALARERAENKIVVEGSTDFFWLTEE